MTYVWYTNGTENKRIFDDKVPEGFYKGYTVKQSTINRKKRIRLEKQLDKDQEKEYLMSLPLKERKIIRAEEAKERKTEKKRKAILDKYDFNSLPNKIQKCLKDGLNPYTEFSFEETELNIPLQKLIAEQTLLFQLDKMPKFYKTVLKQLEALYDDTPQFQYKSDLKIFFSKYIN